MPNAASTPRKTPAAGAPRLNYLVASPQLEGGVFGRSVILLLEHDESGALGLIVNAPTQTPIARLLPRAQQRKECAWMGGPVEPHVGWCIYSTPLNRPDELQLEGGLCVTSSMEVLDTLLTRSEPLMLMLGYSGWGKGQLDRELRGGHWLWVEAGPELVLETPPQERWERAVQLLGASPDTIVRGAQA